MITDACTKFDHDACTEPQCFCWCHSVKVGWGPTYWASHCTVGMSRTGRTYRVTIHGQQVPERIAPPLTMTVWIPCEDSTPKQAAYRALHTWQGRRVMLHCYGQRLVTAWRDANLPKSVAKFVGRRLKAKYPKGIYRDRAAQIEAETCLLKALDARS